MILSGRSINDSMGTFIASQTIKELIKAGKRVKGSIVTILGFTFKENIPDIRNTRVIDIVKELQDYGINVQVFDPITDIHEIKEAYNIDVFACEDQLQPAHAVLLAVPHQYFMDKDWSYIKGLLKNKSGVVIDIKARLDRTKVPEGITLWRL